MKYKYLLLLFGIVFLLIFIQNVSSVCTVTFDKESNYSLGETITAIMSCSEVAEKNDAYTLNWTNGSRFEIELDTGTTPSKINTNFFETFVIPSNYVAVNGTNITAELIGTDLEGSDSENISAAGTNDLIITDIGFTDQNNIRLGKILGIEFEVDDKNSKSLSNAQCEVDLEDGIGNPLMSKELVTHAGKGDVEFILDTTTFSEDRGYLVEIRCFCGVGNTTSSCIDEDGNQVIKSTGEVGTSFDILKWMDINTVTDKSEYIPRNVIFICANVSNNATERVTLHIFHQVRCSSGKDNVDDKDRSLIIADGLDYDERGISANATQMQCKEFLIPELRHLEGKTNECYATTTTWVINEKNEKIKNYPTTSDVFNITSNSLNLPADWEEYSENIYYSVINLSSPQYSDWNGSGTGNIDIMLDSVSGEMFDPKRGNTFPITKFSSFLLVRNIKNITIYNLTGSLMTSRLEYLEDGKLEIEIRSVDISQNGWYNITLEFEDFEERQTDALEGIENRTGTFQLGIDCPVKADTGDVMTCIITAQIEESQTVEKEVDFDCYIKDNGNQYSTVNFNQMITKTPVNIIKTFLVPDSFVDEQQYTVECKANYYNLGSRTDTFSDTFLVDKQMVGDGGMLADTIKRFLEDVEQRAGMYLLLFFLMSCLVMVTTKKFRKEIKGRIKNGNKT